MEDQIVRRFEDEDEESWRWGQSGFLMPVLTRICVGTGARGKILATTSRVS